MNQSERKVYDKLVSQGWKVIRGGWPDFLCLGVGLDGEITVKAVEVKTTMAPKVRPNQVMMHKALAFAGVETHVEMVQSGVLIRPKLSRKMYRQIIREANRRRLNVREMILTMLTEWAQVRVNPQN